MRVAVGRLVGRLPAIPVRWRVPGRERDVRFRQWHPDRHGDLGHRHAPRQLTTRHLALSSRTARPISAGPEARIAQHVWAGTGVLAPAPGASRRQRAGTDKVTTGRAAAPTYRAT
jgi:hypothetical protein